VCVAAWDLAGLTELEPLLDELDGSGSLLFVHPGPAPAPERAPHWWPAVLGYTNQMQCAYAAWLARPEDAWPNLRVVFAILAGGFPVQLERLASRGIDTRGLLHPNVYLDTASYGVRALELSLATYGVGQLVYGSDSPVIESDLTLRSIGSFGQAVADAVCRDNPGRLLQ
jgi:predicted TIM-barrel fold metal-dependent hydrolase